MNALEVCGLKKVYPSFTLEKVSFSVEEGRVCGLVGANGADPLLRIFSDRAFALNGGHGRGQTALSSRFGTE